MQLADFVEAKAPIALRHCVTTVLPIDTAICMFYRIIIVYLTGDCQWGEDKKGQPF